MNEDNQCERKTIRRIPCHWSGNFSFLFQIQFSVFLIGCPCDLIVLSYVLAFDTQFPTSFHALGGRRAVESVSNVPDFGMLSEALRTMNGRRTAINPSDIAAVILS